MKILKTIWRKICAFCSWYVSLYKGTRWYTKMMYIVATFFVSIVLWLGAVDINLLWMFGSSPGFLNGGLSQQPAMASEIYSADDKLIGKFVNENRSPIEFHEVTPMFWKALIDTEDERFFNHWGVDPIGVMGALKDAATGRGGRGASTITQQLAKNLFRTRENYSTGLFGKVPGMRMLVLKSKEWIIAMKLEIKYEKEDILTLYANTVDFGSNAFGIKTAADVYFGKTPKELKVEEAAVLVGMLKATTTYNPRTHYDKSIERRNQVLDNMCTHGDLSQEDCDSLKRLPIVLAAKENKDDDGIAHYFRHAVADELADWCKANNVDLYADGLKVYTTIDSRMQKYAEDAVRKHMKTVQSNFDAEWSANDKPWRDENGREIPGFIEGIAKKLPKYNQLASRYDNNEDSIFHHLNHDTHKVKLFDYNRGTVEKMMTTMDSIRYMVRFMHCGFVAMEPNTGYVKAWVGDVDYSTWQYDKVTAMRQPGSTFKLFVYSAAMEDGMTPCDSRRDEPITLRVYDKKKHQETMWTPHNANGSCSGQELTLKAAFARSINTIAVRVGQDVGIKKVVKVANRMGITSPLEATPALSLGSGDVTLLDMVSSYGTVADYGRRHTPVLVTRILDRDGEVIYENANDSEQALSPRSAFFMQQMLQGGVTEAGGTSQSLSAYIGSAMDTDFGGKTGTTNNHSDAWFMCVSPKLVCGAWVGGEYRCIHFRSGAHGQGSRAALPVCGYFIQSVMSDRNFRQYHGRFGRPSDPDITPEMFSCSSVYEEEADTLDVDSLDVDEYIDAINRFTNEDHNSQPQETETEVEYTDF